MTDSEGGAIVATPSIVSIDSSLLSCKLAEASLFRCKKKITKKMNSYANKIVQINMSFKKIDLHYAWAWQVLDFPLRNSILTDWI